MPAIFDLTTPSGRVITVDAESLADAVIEHRELTHVRHVGYTYTRVSAPPAAVDRDDTDDLDPPPCLDGTPDCDIPLRDLAILWGIHPAILRRRIRANPDRLANMWSHRRRHRKYVCDHTRVDEVAAILR